MLGDGFLAKLEQAAQEAEQAAEEAWHEANSYAVDEALTPVSLRAIAAELRAARKRDRFNREYDRSRTAGHYPGDVQS
jgi:hypothetical protein